MKECLNNGADVLQDAYTSVPAAENIRGNEGVMKQVIYIFILLNMLKEGLLSRDQTQSLEDKLHSIGSKSEDQDKKRIKQAIDKLQTYPLSTEACGICIIFSMHKNRNGAEKDDENLKQVFDKLLNYDVFICIDPSEADVDDKVNDLKYSLFEFYDRYFVFFC